MTVHVSVGNSDDRLTQRAWANFCAAVDAAVATHADSVHGAFHSLPNGPWQSACWGFEAREPSRSILRAELARLGREYDQHSVAWNESTTETL